MKIEHIAIWTNDLERLKTFYTKYFQVTVNEKYFNPGKNFTSYFLSFDEGCRLEIMQMPDVTKNPNERHIQFSGLTHFAISVGSKQLVDQLTEQLRTDGFEVIGEPRITGDGYYESVVLDPDGNHLEITV